METAGVYTIVFDGHIHDGIVLTVNVYRGYIYGIFYGKSANGNLGKEKQLNGGKIEKVNCQIQKALKMLREKGLKMIHLIQ